MFAGVVLGHVEGAGGLPAGEAADGGEAGQVQRESGETAGETGGNHAEERVAGGERAVAGLARAETEVQEAGTG